MEMLIFYVVAILLSAYETKKEKQECKQKAKIGMCDIRYCHLQNCSYFPLNQR